MPTRKNAFPDIPPIPEGPDVMRTQARSYLRFDDVCQDGRLSLGALSPAIGSVMWRPLLSAHERVGALRARGVIPVMNRLALVGTPARVAVMREGALAGEGAARLSHTTREDDDEVARIMLQVWISLTAGADAAEAEAGRLYLEHVFTRPLAPPGARRVVALDAGDGDPPFVPPARIAWQPAHAVLAAPAGADRLGEARADPAPIAFGLRHTDSNQHVNALVYPALFEDAALRHLAALGHSSALLARGVEVGYRKPCFAGERARVVLRVYRPADTSGAPAGFGAIGCVIPEPADAAAVAAAVARFPDIPDARCYLHMVLTP